MLSFRHRAFVRAQTMWTPLAVKPVTPKRRCFAHVWAKSHLVAVVDESPVQQQGDIAIEASRAAPIPSPLCEEFDRYFEFPRPADYAPRFKFPGSYMDFLRNSIRFKNFRERSAPAIHRGVDDNNVHRKQTFSVVSISDSAPRTTSAHLEGNRSAVATTVGYSGQWSLRSV